MWPWFLRLFLTILYTRLLSLSLSLYIFHTLPFISSSLFARFAESPFHLPLFFPHPLFLFLSSSSSSSLCRCLCWCCRCIPVWTVRFLWVICTLTSDLWPLHPYISCLCFPPLLFVLMFLLHRCSLDIRIQAIILYYILLRYIILLTDSVIIN